MTLNSSYLHVDPKNLLAEEASPRKCDGCGKVFELGKIRDLQWAGFDIPSKDKKYALILLEPKKIGTYCANCKDKIEKFLSELKEAR